MAKPSSDDPIRRRRRFSPWTLLAPLALVAVVIMIFVTLGSSCAVKGCSNGSSSSNKTSSNPGGSTKTGTAPSRPNAHYVVKTGDSAQSIAAKFGLSIEQFRLCNRQIPDLYSLQIGEFVNVGSKCKTTVSHTI